MRTYYEHAPSTVSLEAFVEEAIGDGNADLLLSFAEDYYAHHRHNPAAYPLTMPPDGPYAWPAQVHAWIAHYEAAHPGRGWRHVFQTGIRTFFGEGFLTSFWATLRGR